jgi:hypothetical protein
MNSTLKWRREFYKPAERGTETFAPDRMIGAVEGTSAEVLKSDPPGGALARLKLVNPPDIRVGDHVRHDDGGTDPFTGIVTRVGKPYDSGVFNVDLGSEGDTTTVPCEHCEVVFRPRRTNWREDEVLMLFLPAPEDSTPEVTLTGPERGKTVKILRGTGDFWVLTFWLGETRIDSKTYNERDYRGRDYRYFRGLIRMANAWLFQKPVQVGDSWTGTINQGRRDVEVIAVKKLRYRIEYEMPNAGMIGSWQRGLLIGGKLYA